MKFIKRIIDTHILEFNIPPQKKGAVEYLQKIKIQLQIMVFRSREARCNWLTTAMYQALTRLSELESTDSEVAILTLVSLRERARSMGFGEGER